MPPPGRPGEVAEEGEGEEEEEEEEEELLPTLEDALLLVPGLEPPLLFTPPFFLPASSIAGSFLARGTPFCGRPAAPPLPPLLLRFFELL
jgi:hypothetical protein